MNITNIDYFLLGIIIILLVFSMALGPQRVVRIIIGNYIISLLTIGVYVFMEMINYNLKTGGLDFLASPNDLQVILVDYKKAIGLTFYLIFLVVFINKSKIQGGDVDEKWIHAWNIIYGPLAALSIVSTLMVVVLGNSILNYNQVVVLANTFISAPGVRSFILLFPVWLMLPGLVLLFGSLDVKLRLAFKK